MSAESPGSRPSDDVSFLGPAIPPRDSFTEQPDAEGDELPPPFIPGTAWRRAEERVQAETESDDLSADATTDDWPEDDFPWLMDLEGEGEGEAPPASTDEATVVESISVEAEFVVAAELDPAPRMEPEVESDPVDAAALPIDEWTEDGSSVDTVETAPADPALIEVAERLERIAASLRSGRVTEAVEEGDPLRLLITGYALGYAQSRRGGEG